jgi:CRP-like cAMP-binding protein
VRRRQREFEAELGASKLFVAFTPDQVHELARSSTKAREPKGTIFSREGERGDELVVLLEGNVEVRRGDRVLAQLGPGEHFGEVALLDESARRSATVVAISPVVVASRHHFDALLAANPTVRDAIARVLHERSVVPEERTGPSSTET